MGTGIGTSAVSIKNVYKKRSQITSVWFRFRRNRLAMFGLVLFLLMALAAASAPLIADYEKEAVAQKMAARLQPPSAEHLFGTDEFGRDQFARIIYGARISLFVGLATISISATVGTIIGAAAGYFGGGVDNVIMRITDIFLAVPQTIMAISVSATLGPGLVNLLIALSISAVPRFARIVRSSVLSIRGQEYVEAARAYGAGDARIILRHIIPNAIGPIIVQATLNMGSTILSVASLSFIGLGIQPPTPEWGSMLSAGRAQMRYYPHLVIVPGIAIVIAVLALNLIGDGLRDALDPRLKN